MSPDPTPQCVFLPIELYSPLCRSPPHVVGSDLHKLEMSVQCTEIFRKVAHQNVNPGCKVIRFLGAGR